MQTANAEKITRILVEEFRNEHGNVFRPKRWDMKIDKYPNKFLLKVIFNQGVDWKKAWKVPTELEKRLGHFNIRRIAKTPLSELRRAISKYPALHRFTATMARHTKEMAKKLPKEYSGSARNIWKNVHTFKEAIARFEKFSGIGQKKARMAARILATDNGTYFEDPESLYLPVDIMVKRVFLRAGLVSSPDAATDEKIARTAQELNPRCPGELDSAWRIGQKWCLSERPDCDGKKEGEPCPLNGVCPKRYRHKNLNSLLGVQ